MLILVERITFFSLLHIMRCRNKSPIVYHFDGVSLLASWLCRVLTLWGIRVPAFTPVPWYYGDMQDDDGIHFLRERVALDRRVADLHSRLCEADPVISRFVKRFSCPEIALKYFHSRLEREALVPLRRLVLCAWVAQRHGGTDQCLILSERGRLFGILDQIAIEYGGMCHRGYFSLKTLKEGGVVRHLLLVRQLMAFVARHSFSARFAPVAAPAPQCATVTQIYTRSKVCVQNREKNELFWLRRNDSKATRVVVAGYDVDCAEPGALEYWKESGVRFYGMAATADKWTPSRSSHRLSLDLVKALARDWASCLGRGGRVEHVKWLLLLVESYALWTDFFRQHSTRVILSYFFHDHGARLAIRDLDGVAVGCQDSISEFDMRVASTCYSDLEFVHSGFYAAFPLQRPIPTTFLINGYLHPVKEAVNNSLADTARIRSQLVAKGVKYVICFFDENLIDRWYFFNPEGGRDMYARLFKAVLADETLGLICKPKNGEATLVALRPIQGLLDAALATGRMRLHRTASLCRDAYPAVHAAAADICIGDTAGGTAAFEASLLGIPAILIDVLGRKPCFGGVSLDGKVVFPDMGAALEAVENHRRMAGEPTEIGDWTPWLPELLSRNDDQGAHRVGDVLDILLGAFDAGKGREMALAAVREAYAEAWGSWSVIEKQGPEAA